MNRLRVTTLIIVFLILILLTAGGYFFLQNNPEEMDNDVAQSSSDVPQSTATPTTNPEEDVMEEWETYTSEEYNYEFKYPSQATLSDQSDGYVGVSYMGEKQRASGRTQTELFDGYAFNVADVTGDGYEDLDEFFAQKVEQLEDICTTIGDPEETAIDGRRAITHELSCLGDTNTYYVQNGDTYLEMSLLTAGDEEDLPEYTETVNQIFSTFKFGE